MHVLPFYSGLRQAALAGLMSAMSAGALAAGGAIPEQDARLALEADTKTRFTMPVYRTLAGWEARKAHLKNQILSAAGLLPMPEKPPLNPKVHGRIEHGDYTIERVSLETLPGYYLCGNLYRPKGKKAPFPAVASPHGHWSYGRLENSAQNSVPARGVNLARQGYVLFAYDMVGYTDTIQTPHVFGGPRESLWSFGPLALQLWNSIRVVDYLESLPDVDKTRLAATGASGGATQTFLLAAVDERIRYSVPVNMVSAHFQGGSPCENAPGLRLDTFNVEIAALMAPRPMLLVSATGDWTKDVPTVEYPAINRIYELYGKTENLSVVQIDAPHNYNQDTREQVYRFLGKHALEMADPAGLHERSFTVEPLQNMLVWHNRTLPPDAAAIEQVFEAWKSLQARLTAGGMRERLRYALAAEYPAEVISAGRNGGLVLSRPGKGDRVPAEWIEGKGAPVLVVHEGGARAARSSETVKRLIAAGRPVLLIDAFNTGAATGKRDTGDRYFLTFHRSDDQNRVQDVLTALGWLRARQPGATLELDGIGKAALWCLFAAAVAAEPVKVRAAPVGFSGSDGDYLEQFYVPGIRRAGGIEAALTLTAGMR